MLTSHGDGPDESVLLVSDLTKAYLDRPVLRGVSLSVGSGEVVGVVGPNGAGKTTLMECVEGIRVPDGGSVQILGRRPADGPWTYHPLFGALLQESSLPERIRVGEALRLFASFHARPLDPVELMTRMGLAEDRRRPFHALSGGQKRRVLLALALIGRPPLILLDEPTAGLDPAARVAIWSLVRRSTAAGTAVMFTTHDMAEAEEYADRLYLLNEGKVISAGSPGELLRLAGLAARLSAPRYDAFAAWLPTVPGHIAVWVIGETVYGFGDTEYPGRVRQLLELARSGADDAGATEGGLTPQVAGAVLDRLSTGPARLEDLYLLSTGSIYATG